MSVCGVYYFHVDQIEWGIASTSSTMIFGFESSINSFSCWQVARFLVSMSTYWPIRYFDSEIILWWLCDYNVCSFYCIVHVRRTTEIHTILVIFFFWYKLVDCHNDIYAHGYVTICCMIGRGSDGVWELKLSCTCCGRRRGCRRCLCSVVCVRAHKKEMY